MNNEQVLNSMLHTVQMGQHGIKSVVDTAQDPALQQELRSQSREYDNFEHKALLLAQKHGLHLTDVNPAVLKMSQLMSKARLMMGDVDSKIAGMMIQGNTRGMILGFKKLHKYPEITSDVQDLAQQLLNRENINIQKVQPFL